MKIKRSICILCAIMSMQIGVTSDWKFFAHTDADMIMNNIYCDDIDWGQYVCVIFVSYLWKCILYYRFKVHILYILKQPGDYQLTATFKSLTLSATTKEKTTTVKVQDCVNASNFDGPLYASTGIQVVYKVEPHTGRCYHLRQLPNTFLHIHHVIVIKKNVLFCLSFQLLVPINFGPCLVGTNWCTKPDLKRKIVISNVRKSVSMLRLMKYELPKDKSLAISNESKLMVINRKWV